jgi:hypothetical protein
MTSAAGKCLKKMDLPLARCRPSPAYCLREAMRLARSRSIAVLKPCRRKSLRVEATGARLEFVGRAHRKRIRLKRWQPSPALGRGRLRGAIALPLCGHTSSDKPGAIQCQEQMTVFKIFFEFSSGWLLCELEHHVAGLFAALATILQVKRQIILEDVLAGRIAKLRGGAVNGLRRAFQFNKCANTGLVQFD